MYGKSNMETIWKFNKFYSEVKKQQLELNMEQWTGSKLGQEYIKAVYCHSAYLNFYAEYVM